MIKKLKSNKILILFLLFVCIVFIINPMAYAKSSLDAISVWAFKLLPVLFPFFVLTRIIVNLFDDGNSVMDKFFYKLYHTRCSAKIYFLSVLSGYPMGAKLICNMYELGRIDNIEAKRMLSFCSVSGPMFMIGTVGVGILHSYKAGVIILIANIIASLINGFIYRGKIGKNNNINYVGKKENNPNLLFESVYDGLKSILMVGGFIVISFLLIDMLKNLNILPSLSNFICKIFNCQQNFNIILCCLEGIVEMTRGIISLSVLSISLTTKTIISSTLIALGGISILMQSLSFLSKLNISKRTVCLQKLTQAVICLVSTIILCLIFM